MKKLLVVFLVLCSLTSFAQAQEKPMAIGGGLVLSLPMGDFGDVANTGFGFTGTFELGFTPQIVGTGTIGYITWGTESDNFDFSAIPILAGVKYYFGETAGLYALGRLGITMLKTTVEIPSFDFFGETIGGGSESATDSELTLAFGAGYEMPLNENLLLDLSGALNLISDANHITVRAGIKYGL